MQFDVHNRVAVDSLTFVLADLLDPGQRVDLHEGVRNTEDMHHVHDALGGRGGGHRGGRLYAVICTVKKNTHQFK